MAGAAMTAGRAPLPGQEPGAAQRQFGADLRHWRTVRGWPQRELAERVNYSREFVAMVERGARWPTEDFARRADAVLATGGVLLSRWPEVEAERAAVMPSLQPRALAAVLPLRRAEPDRSTSDAPVTGDPLAAMVIDVLRACPGARVAVFAMDGDGTGPASTGDRDGSAVVHLANFRTGTTRRRANGARQ
ncbi:helix-turn-helix domain-containing protein [Dactylosporangium sp. CA-092794]|uniref:helix-turn-helix domain-containing protein n=1 Tax=Dactylosporangium sp. CA-092794 TaxID=3239929 RepID=UPI003D8EA107